MLFFLFKFSILSLFVRKRKNKSLCILSLKKSLMVFSELFLKILMYLSAMSSLYPLNHFFFKVFPEKITCINPQSASPLGIWMFNYSINDMTSALNSSND